MTLISKTQGWITVDAKYNMSRRDAYERQLVRDRNLIGIS